jgi:hypothetical protein
MAEGRMPKIALKWMPKQSRARERPKKNWMEGIKKAMHERNLNDNRLINNVLLKNTHSNSKNNLSGTFSPRK